jgi:hypothetical protein
VAKFWNAFIPKQNLHTITFDHRVKVSGDGTLADKITKHGGGRTSIPEAFVEMENHLQAIPSN